MVGNAMADILVTSAMVFQVNMWRSVSGGSPEANFVLISAAYKIPERIGLSFQRQYLSKNCEVDY